MAVQCYQWLCVLAGLTLATPLPVHNNYLVLSGHQVWQTEGSIKAAKLLGELEREGLTDILGHGGGDGAMFRVFPESRSVVSDALLKEGVEYHVVVSDLARHLKGDMRLRRREAVNGNTEESCLKNDCPKPYAHQYMKFEEMEWYLKELAGRSSRVELKSIGKSVEGRDIWRVHIKAKTGGKTRRAIWIEGGIHAREWISAAVALHLIHLFDKASKSTLQDLDVYVVPMSNPDGYVYTWDHDRLWRKNRRQSAIRQDCPGVDLNRNWDKDYGVGASKNPCSLTYQGTEAFSEPETRALKKEMEHVASKGNLDVVIALHSYGQVLLYPWGGLREAAPNTEEMKAAGNAFASAAARKRGTVYKVENSASGLYLASGATDDWAKGKLGTPYSYTLELPDKGMTGFELPPENIQPTVKDVWKGLQKLLTYVEKNKIQ